MIDQIIEYNKDFVAQKRYEKYLTDKYPNKKLAVLSCMDTRLTKLLTAALGLENGDAKIIKNAGGLVISAFDSAMRSLIVAIYELGVEEIMVIAHTHCGACHMNYEHFHDQMKAKGVTQYRLIKTHKFSSGQLDRLRRNENVNIFTLAALCDILDCGLEDVVTYT